MNESVRYTRLKLMGTLRTHLLVFTVQSLRLKRQTSW
jgi:hypothetical protein